MAVAAVLSASRGKAKSLRVHSHAGRTRLRRSRPVSDAPPSHTGA